MSLLEILFTYSNISDFLNAFFIVYTKKDLISQTYLYHQKIQTTINGFIYMSSKETSLALHCSHSLTEWVSGC